MKVLGNECVQNHQNKTSQMHRVPPYSGYIPFEFNFVLFVLIPCGTYIFQMKKAFPQCHVCKMAAQNKNKTNEISNSA